MCQNVRMPQNVFWSKNNFSDRHLVYTQFKKRHDRTNDWWQIDLLYPWHNANRIYDFWSKTILLTDIWYIESFKRDLLEQMTVDKLADHICGKMPHMPQCQNATKCLFVKKQFFRQTFGLCTVKNTCTNDRWQIDWSCLWPNAIGLYDFSSKTILPADIWSVERFIKRHDWTNESGQIDLSYLWLNANGFYDFLSKKQFCQQTFVYNVLKETLLNKWLSKNWLIISVAKANRIYDFWTKTILLTDIWSIEKLHRDLLEQMTVNQLTYHICG